MMASFAVFALIMSGCGNGDTKKTEDQSSKTAETSQNNATAQEDLTTKNTEKNEEVTRDAGGYIVDQELPKEATYINDLLIASKKYPLPADFAPGESDEARAAFEELKAAALLDGFTLSAFSTYRSYDRQVELYANYVNRDGREAADTYSARPGYSEHQTGLAFDIGEVGNEQYFADNGFATTAAGKWLAKNAHTYGFVMRYPKGKEDITGYMHESWHFRYVGKDIATDIYKNNSTLEEYLEIGK
ncbi:M15 family metallopeptidase [Viridibacillus sp. YIM B01967]|uniref:M15 family metallopeptidase n=2 Tax=Viridibacillus soli TaxID=2798301 RepID=A0ABS1H5U4_9BACL|nr:M15 family metallopeptidase [Viridibacillus soli]